MVSTKNYDGVNNLFTDLTSEEATNVNGGIAPAVVIGVAIVYAIGFMLVFVGSLHKGMGEGDME